MRCGELFPNVASRSVLLLENTVRPSSASENLHYGLHTPTIWPGLNTDVSIILKFRPIQ